jgi:hypothetical protein
MSFSQSVPEKAEANALNGRWKNGFSVTMNGYIIPSAKEVTLHHGRRQFQYDRSTTNPFPVLSRRPSPVRRRRTGEERFPTALFSVPLH